MYAPGLWLGYILSGAGAGGVCAALLGALSAGILTTSFFASAVTVFLVWSCLLPGCSSGSNVNIAELVNEVVLMGARTLVTFAELVNEVVHELVLRGVKLG